MNNTGFYLRKKSFDSIEKELVGHFGLVLCFKNNEERLYKNENILVTCKKKYISVLEFNERNHGDNVDIIKYLSVVKNG